MFQKAKNQAEIWNVNIDIPVVYAGIQPKIQYTSEKHGYTG